MAKLLKLRRGSTSGHSSFTGAEGEVTIDTTKDTAVVHDGSTAGGRALLREDLSNLPAGTIDNADINASAAIDGTKISPNFGSQVVQTTGNIVVGGTVDGVDIATRDTLFGGLTSSSGVLTDGVAATTQAASDNSTKVATTAYTTTAISNLVDSSPSALNTLNELAAALGDDANFATTVNNSIATKLPLAGGTMTGDISHGDNVKGIYGTGNDLQIYHDGSNSLIRDLGTGDLLVQGSQLKLQDANGNDYLRAFSSGAVYLHYSNSSKLETTNTGVSVTGGLVASGNVTAFSDSRLKTEIHTIKDPLEKVDRLRGVTFKWLHTDKPSSGVIAQEVQEVFPELVEATTHEGKEVLSVDYGKLVGVLIESIKALKAEFEAHKAECAKQHGGE